MSRYEPLTAHLKRQSSREVSMTFAEIERLLQAPLPRSARVHRPWWSNNEAGNTAVRAWRKAGRKTAQVDMAGERVVFVRDGVEPMPRRPDARGQKIEVTLAAEAMIGREIQDLGVDRDSAIASILNAEAIARRTRAIEALRAENPNFSLSLYEIVESIREDRDSR